MIYKFLYRFIALAVILFVILGLFVISLILISDSFGWNGTGDTHTDEALQKVVQLLSYPLALAIGAVIVGVLLAIILGLIQGLNALERWKRGSNNEEFPQ